MRNFAAYLYRFLYAYTHLPSIAKHGLQMRAYRCIPVLLLRVHHCSYAWVPFFDSKNHGKSEMPA